MTAPTFQFRAQHPRFLVGVDGDCMEPLIHHGDRIEVDTTLTPAYGDTVVAEVSGVGLLVKRYEPASAGGWIVALNAAIRYPLDEHCRIIGVVRSVYRFIDTPASRRYFGARERQVA